MYTFLGKGEIFLKERVNAYEALRRIYQAVQDNHNKMREEPDSDGTVHDAWEEEDDALSELEDSLSEAIDSFEEAMEHRKSLKRMLI